MVKMEMNACIKTEYPYEQACRPHGCYSRCPKNKKIGDG